MRAPIKYLTPLAIFATVTVLYADTTPPQPYVPPATPSASGTTIIDPATLSVAQMEQQSTSMIAQMNDVYQHMLYQQKQAKKQQDVIKLNCLNDKLVEAKAQLNIADTTNQSLQAALSKNSNDRVSAFAQLTTTNNNVGRLREDANACAGATELSKQEAGVIVTFPFLPDDPTVGNPFVFVEYVEAPGYASPFN